MRKLLILCLVFVVYGCGSLKTPVDPNTLIVIEGYATDADEGELIRNEKLHINNETVKVDSSGHFKAVLKTNNRNSVIVSLFPFQPVVLALENIRNNGNRARIKLNLPQKLKEYSRLLKKARRNGYKIVSVKEWQQHPAMEDSTKLLVMRHDVDYDDLYAKAFAYLEHRKGIHSTYYFRWSTADPSTIGYVKSFGNEVGLHYETLATLAKKRNIFSKEQISNDILVKCRELLKGEIKKFEALFGDIYSISSHGEERNRILGIPNVVLTRFQPLADFYVVVDGSQLESLPPTEQIFVADSGGKWSPYSLDQAIDEGHRRIYCLIHPTWWRERS